MLWRSVTKEIENLFVLSVSFPDNIALRLGHHI